jgi:hypothetical protein
MTPTPMGLGVTLTVKPLAYDANAAKRGRNSKNRPVR